MHAVRQSWRMAARRSGGAATVGQEDFGWIPYRENLHDAVLGHGLCPWGDASAGFVCTLARFCTGFHSWFGQRLQIIRLDEAVVGS